MDGIRGKHKLWMYATIVLLASGCVYIWGYTYLSRETYPPKPGDAFIETFYLPDFTTGAQHLLISETYDTIARFDVVKDVGGSLEKKAHEKAREIGGDAVIIQFSRSVLIGGGPYSASVFVIRYKE